MRAGCAGHASADDGHLGWAKAVCQSQGFRPRWQAWLSCMHALIAGQVLQACGIAQIFG
jgi:hypothetical protein